MNNRVKLNKIQMRKIKWVRVVVY